MTSEAEEEGDTSRRKEEQHRKRYGCDTAAGTSSRCHQSPGIEPLSHPGKPRMYLRTGLVYRSVNLLLTRPPSKSYYYLGTFSKFPPPLQRITLVFFSFLPFRATVPRYLLIGTGTRIMLHNL